MMGCTPLQEAAKPVWAKQLTRLSCLVVYVKFQLMTSVRFYAYIGIAFVFVHRLSALLCYKVLQLLLCPLSEVL